MPPNVKLTHVHRVSEKSVLLTAKEGATLDFGTINSCPPAHRGLVQQNGLIAKVWLSISEKGLSAQEQKSIFVDGAGTVPIWKEALTLSGLTTADTAFQPTSATQIPWPILREAEYKERVVFAQARQLCETVDSSHFCVPICFLQTYSHKIKTYAVNVCVVWMPLFKKTLVAWSESFLSKKKVIPKSHLTRLVSQTASALNAWHKIILNTQASEIRGCPETLEIDDILVSESNGEPTFSISASMMKNRSKIDAAVKLKDSQYANLQYYPYLAPEQVSPTGYIIKKPTFDVWVIGMILFNVATGVPSLKAQVKKMADQAEKTAPFNHPDISPETIVNTIRTEMEKSGYGPDLISLTALLLSVDYRCRPTLNIVENMMVELDRSNPIFRFPFSIGSYDLVRLPDSKDVEVNLSARKYVTKDLCVLCNEVRKLVKCTHGDGTHTPAITSASWASDEPLPGFIRPSCAMSYLYPLVPHSKTKRSGGSLRPVLAPRRKTPCMVFVPVVSTTPTIKWTLHSCFSYLVDLQYTKRRAATVNGRSSRKY
ncbi:hypothetical protein AGDE_13160 [Angomonas deanei]|uniref:Protein kinase domain-containing protein n=1 Tax=Angomonas deanei TaxID=59799 RepID=A0A7G2C7J2_9TRYP|nr:hypothetical protein AGDE_13160 [Angomonas deanei]CAD2215549.1 hypothetical protein, conserved [Angomonas deanei]|eukprot:EPY22691.1 hypothetical protein AGDE_13160 [Angomonas deanei]